MKRLEEQYSWIKDYLRRNGSADACDVKFNDEFADYFHVKQEDKNLWGSNICPTAMNRIREMYISGDIIRRRVTIGGGGSSWIYTYSLKER